MIKRAVIYTRVSTIEQTCEQQVTALREVAERADWEVLGVVREEGVSGNGTPPKLQELLKRGVRREYDVLLAWSVDRLGRSLRELIRTFDVLRQRNIGLYLHQQAIDTTTPAGKAMFQMCGVFAEFERALIVERTRAGLERARAQGKRLGRQPNEMPTDAREQCIAMRKAGKTYRQIQQELNCSARFIRETLGFHGMLGKEYTQGVGIAQLWREPWEDF